jgi:hypothetical protein
MGTKLQSRGMGIILTISIILLTGSMPVSKQGSGTGSDIQYRQISMEDYADKVAGGWLGQAIAVLWGQWTEGKWQGQ